MKNLFRDHSYDMVKMFLNQFATAIFGFSLVLATEKAQNTVLRNITSVAAILFYLFLLYTMTWELGFRDRVGVLHGTKPNRPWKGALISLFANSINFLLADAVLNLESITRIVITHDMDWIYDGQAHSWGGHSVSEATPLVDGHKTQVDTLLEITNVGDGPAENALTVRILNDGDENMTDNYELTYECGELVIRPLPITVVSETTHKGIISLWFYE